MPLSRFMTMLFEHRFNILSNICRPSGAVRASLHLQYKFNPVLICDRGVRTHKRFNTKKWYSIEIAYVLNVLCWIRRFGEIVISFKCTDFRCLRVFLCSCNFIFILHSSLSIHSLLLITFYLVSVAIFSIQEFRGLSFLLLLLLLFFLLYLSTFSSILTMLYI